MAAICPRCHANGNRVEMKSVFLRSEKRVVEVPCDSYPDGTVITKAERLAETAVFSFECPACGLTMEGRTPSVLPTDPESP